MIHYDKLTLLVDPVLADQGTYAPIPAKGMCERNPLVSLPFNLNFLKNVDAVLLTHLHNDHFDQKAINYLDKDIPIICHSVDAEKVKSHGFSMVSQNRRNASNISAGYHYCFCRRSQIRPIKTYYNKYL